MPSVSLSQMTPMNALLRLLALCRGKFEFFSSFLFLFFLRVRRPISVTLLCYFLRRTALCKARKGKANSKLRKCNLKVAPSHLSRELLKTEITWMCEYQNICHASKLDTRLALLLCDSPPTHKYMKDQISPFVLCISSLISTRYHH